MRELYVRCDPVRAGAVFVLACLTWLFTGCSVLRPERAFRVLPASPDYLLRSPDKTRTPLSEVLKRYNGFVPGQPFIDLRPRMELRVENAYYQKGSSRRGLEGFLGTEVARFSVGSEGLQLLSVQSMKDRPESDLPVQSLISSQAEHFHSYRLYYELVFARSTNTHGSALLGADSPAELDSLSTQLVHPETVCNSASPHCVVFPEACSVSVEIQIVVNGKTQSVVWGTQLRAVAANAQHIAVKRLYNANLVPIKLDSRDPQQLRLPLLPGDEITWR